jgi:FAD/FMN-containing dehydrogenase
VARPEGDAAVIEALEELFGRVSTDVDAYCGDRTENQPRRPAFVVEAEQPEQVGDLLALASEQGIPVTPRVTGENVGGLAIPAEGGIVLDLQRLKAIEIDAEHMVAWIEPGVSWAELKEAAARHDLVLGYPLAPPDASVLACALMDGLSTMSLSHGSLGDWIQGVVAYLADGTRVVTGSAALSGRPLSRGPLPDLTGMFVNWYGSTGVVVRLALSLWPKRLYRYRGVIPCDTAEKAADVMRRGASLGLFDDLACLGWPAAKWAFGLGELGARDPAEPEAYVIADFGAITREDLDFRIRRLRRISPSEPISAKLLIRLAPDLAPFAELPTRLDFLMDHPGGGLSWVGTYGPLDRLAEGARAGIELMARHGMPPLMVARPMRGGHFAVLRFIERFDRRDEAETARVREANIELGRTLMDLGYVPYKCPEILYDEVFERLDPGFVHLMRTLKRAVDPKGILNPDRWRLGEACS